MIQCKFVRDKTDASQSTTPLLIPLWGIKNNLLYGSVGCQQCNQSRHFDWQICHRKVLWPAEFKPTGMGCSVDWIHLAIQKQHAQKRRKMGPSSRLGLTSALYQSLGFFRHSVHIQKWLTFHFAETSSGKLSNVEKTQHALVLVHLDEPGDIEVCQWLCLQYELTGQPHQSQQIWMVVRSQLLMLQIMCLDLSTCTWVCDLPISAEATVNLSQIGSKYEGLLHN